MASYADVVHSIDRLSLVTALSAAAQAAERELTALVQVSLEADPDAARGGVPPELAAELAEAVVVSPGLRLGGVMAVAPLGADPAEAFAGLARIADDVRHVHPGATWLSAGMSADLEAAVEHGATHLRVGSAVLGQRPSVQ